MDRTDEERREQHEERQELIPNERRVEEDGDLEGANTANEHSENIEAANAQRTALDRGACADGGRRKEADPELGGEVPALDDVIAQDEELCCDAPHPSDAEVSAARRPPRWSRILANVSSAVRGALRSVFGGRQRDDE